MGAAIESFKGAGAVYPPIALRPREEVLGPHAPPQRRLCGGAGLDAEAERGLRGGKAPVVDLDSKAYKMVSQYEALCPRGAPSLVKCAKLKVKGKVKFAGPNVKIEGEFSVVNTTDEPKTLTPASYTGEIDISDSATDEDCMVGCSIM